MSYTRMTIKPRMSGFKKLLIVLVIITIGIYYLGRWLPQHLVLEEGVSLKVKPKDVFSCLLNSTTEYKKNSGVKKGAAINLLLDIFPQGIVTDLVKNDYMVISDNNGASLTIMIDDEDGAYWLQFIFVQDLGGNPLNRIYQNWLREEKEQSITSFLVNFERGYLEHCK